MRRFMLLVALCMCKLSSACTTFDFDYDYRPQGASAWIKPDVVFESVSAPFAVRSSRETFEIVIDFKIVRDEGFASVKVSQGASVRSMTVNMPLPSGKNKHLHMMSDEATGDLWVFKLTPVCASLL